MNHPTSKQLLKRRANLLYRLRRKGVSCKTKARIIYIPFYDSPTEHIETIRLCKEYNFVIQYILV